MGSAQDDPATSVQKASHALPPSQSLYQSQTPAASRESRRSQGLLGHCFVSAPASALAVVSRAAQSIFNHAIGKWNTRSREGERERDVGVDENEEILSLSLSLSLLVVSSCRCPYVPKIGTGTEGWPG